MQENTTSVRARRLGPRRSMAVVGLATLVGVAGCQGEPNASGGAPAESPTAPPVEFVSSVRDGAKDVRPDQALTVNARQGELHAVRVTDPRGKELRGTSEGGSWRLVDVLNPGTAYTMTLTGANADGQVTKSEQSFTTLTPDVEATYRVTPDEETVGVGMPVMVTFDSPVQTPEQRAAVEKRLKVSTSPATKGSWGWVGDTQVMWRPEAYWKPGTKVDVTAALKGVQTGSKKWVTEDKKASFTIAPRARISTVDLDDHTMTVRENGKKIATYPISAGKGTASYETRSGTKIITEKRAFMVMDAASLGVPEDDPNYYRTEVDHALRVTNTGEFLHSAPWSVGAQGRRNVSHGCVNLGPRAARTMFQASIVGDVVDFKDSDRRMKPEDGVPVWLFDYPEWQKRSALATAKPANPSTGTASPTGSATAG